MIEGCDYYYLFVGGVSALHCVSRLRRNIQYPRRGKIYWEDANKMPLTQYGPSLHALAVGDEGHVWWLWLKKKTWPWGGVWQSCSKLFWNHNVLDSCTSLSSLQLENGCSGHQSTAELNWKTLTGIPATPKQRHRSWVRFHASRQSIWWFVSSESYRTVALWKDVLEQQQQPFFFFFFFLTAALNVRKWKHLQVTKLIRLKTVTLCFSLPGQEQPRFLFSP